MRTITRQYIDTIVRLPYAQLCPFVQFLQVQSFILFMLNCAHVCNFYRYYSWSGFEDSVITQIEQENGGMPADVVDFVQATSTWSNRATFSLGGQHTIRTLHKAFTMYQLPFCA